MEYEELAEVYAVSRDDEGDAVSAEEKTLPKSSKAETEISAAAAVKKFEFSKLVFLILFCLTMGVTLFAMLLMWKIGSAAPLTYLIPSVYTAFATGTGFYFDKAKKENLIKLRSTYGDDVVDKIRGDN